ncbi:5-formyltetrahydrofolate cyclo-ligase [Plantactinospora sp. KLBMP9567]|uniref:5-formyltetrahydrofolate cyclo-ligase n=1 Tax=Plantactinospora sp. KLBMP9567 TaxID=3085900 RepID=UPI002982190F|nr:5-formyltetrahydrofolate cyclo-ligase [Plantactinospora sp. KLBMP9567]MDW5324968.1 5-formyltetrahydrofolate cyclo-ligase [Plantactinospora sp. KLBMP9567]
MDQEKGQAREKVWRRLEQSGAALPPGAHGRIPNFLGADRASARLAELPQWRRAKVVKSNPDKGQLPVRLQALSDRKLLYMAVPKLAKARPFYLLDPSNLGAPPTSIATGAGAAAHALTVEIGQMQPIDLVVCGSVAVNRDGVRVGKGAGYSDIEVALLTEADLIAPTTLIVATVHELQVLDEPLPESPHDFSVDLIVTPQEVIWCAPPRRPRGIYWNAISDQQIAEIPALACNAQRPK